MAELVLARKIFISLQAKYEKAVAVSSDDQWSVIQNYRYFEYYEGIAKYVGDYNLVDAGLTANIQELVEWWRNDDFSDDYYITDGLVALLVKQEGLVFSEVFAEGYSDQKGMIEALEQAIDPDE